jgi:hypothetical protein
VNIVAEKATVSKKLRVGGEGCIDVRTNEEW